MKFTLHRQECLCYLVEGGNFFAFGAAAVEVVHGNVQEDRAATAFQWRCTMASVSGVPARPCSFM